MKELPSVVQKVNAERSRMSITEFFRNRFPVLFGMPRIRRVVPLADIAREPSKPRILCIGRIHRGRMTIVTAFPRKGTGEDRKQIRRDQGGQDHVTVSQGREEERKT